MWKDIEGYEGHYQIDEYGNVKSIKFAKEKILSPYIAHSGYHQVTLIKNNIKEVAYIHRLVAKAFLDNPNNEPTVNHKDGDKSNNYYLNLEYVSYSYNNQHAYDNGLHKKGELHYRSILTEEQVKEIKSLGKYSSFKSIADKYGVSQATIRDVIVGNTWKSISI